MGRQRGFTRASALGPIAEFVDYQGGRIARVFDRVDLPLGIVESPDLLLPLPEQFRILESAARETGDPYFGATLGSLVRIENLSAFGLWVSKARTVGGAIDRSNRGLNTFLQTGTNLRLHECGGVTRWSIEFLDPGKEGRFHNELLGVSYLTDALRSFLGRSWSPDLIRVTGGPGIRAAVLEDIFRAPVSTGNSVSSVEFSTDLMTEERKAATQTADGDPAPGDGMTPVPTAPDQHEAIQAMTAIAMLESYPRIDWIASKLGMTRRTLQRRLASHGTTFSRLVDDMLSERAAYLLAHGNQPITDIAHQLGYSDAAHFSRAFSRWTAQSPSAFRNCQTLTG